MVSEILGSGLLILAFLGFATAPFIIAVVVLLSAGAFEEFGSDE